jgi:hypothetical protein
MNADGYQAHVHNRPICVHLRFQILRVAART